MGDNDGELNSSKNELRKINTGIASISETLDSLIKGGLDVYKNVRTEESKDRAMIEEKRLKLADKHFTIDRMLILFFFIGFVALALFEKVPAEVAWTVGTIAFGWLLKQSAPFKSNQEQE